ncbi:MAG TPA: transcription termination/antitermination NusG family protein, partial [Longimicrobium sp.]|nr:transcription termination/antitermination NusG family protein [Longimicrobium sp.]
MADAKWYAIQSYSGHENKVQRLIQRRIDEEQGEPEQKQIQEVMVPTQEVVEIRNGKRVTVTRKLYPGYVLVKMVYNQRTGGIISGIQGVIKFLGSGAEPQALSDDELAKIFGVEAEAPVG